MDGQQRRVAVRGHRIVHESVLVSKDPANITDIKDIVEALQPNNKDGTRTATAIAQIPKFEKVLLDKAISVCRQHGIAYFALKPAQRLFITHYRCHSCKLVPLYYLDFAHCRRVRCRRCGQQVAFKNSGKYGKIRKNIARLLLKEETLDCHVSQQC